ncbi:MAG: DNA double-strand break repair nuclease NurA [Candidatus Bathyarchaeia archaeon]
MNDMKELDYRDISKKAFPFIRDFLSPIISEAECEALHPKLYSELIHNGTDVIVRKLKEYNEKRKALLRGLREKIPIGKFAMDENIFSPKLVASDASNNGIDFRSAFIPLYASAAVLAEGKKIIDEPIFRVDEHDIWPDEPRARTRESLLAFKLQFEVTLDAIERWRPKYVLMDGSLLLNFWLLPMPGSTEEYKRDFELTLLKSVNLLNVCFEMDIPVAGFVKRTRMNDICSELGFSRMRDTALLDAILNLGEYTVPKPISKRNRVLEYYERICHKIGIPEKNIKNILDIHFSYIKTGFTTPFRLEVPSYCLDRFMDIGSLVLSTSEEDGIPFALKEVDGLVRITTSTSNIRTLMIYSKALDLVKSHDFSPEDLNLLTLQYGEPWAIRDEEYLKDLLGV